MDPIGTREVQVYAALTECLANLGIDEEPDKCLQLLAKGPMATPRKMGANYPIAERIALRAAQLAHNAPGRYMVLTEKMRQHNFTELAPIMQILHTVSKDIGIGSTMSYSKTPVSSSASSILKSTSETTIPSTPVTLIRKSSLNRSITTNSTSFANLEGTTLAERTPMLSAIKTKQPIGVPKEIGDNAFMTMLKRPNFTESEESQSSLPPSCEEQEQLLVQESLHVLLGVNSTCIRKVIREGDRIDFVHNDHLDASLVQVAEYVANIARDYALIQNFIDVRCGFKFGRVQHALAAAIRIVIQDYLVLIGQLESHSRQSDKFGAQKLLYSLRHCENIIKAVAKLIHRIESEIPDNTFNDSAFNGTKILGILHEMTINSQGSPEVHKLYEHILSKASEAYLTMLRTWIWEGKLQDPFREFFIQERDSFMEDETSWDHRFILCENAPIPSFLQAWTRKILECGKNVCVLKRCSKTIESASILDQPSHSIEDIFKTEIDAAFKSSNKAILDLLLKDSRLQQRFTLIKSIIMLTQSDYFMHFLDISLDELCRPAQKISVPKIQSLFELALKGSSIGHISEDYADLLRIEFKTTTLFQQLGRINAMMGLQMSKSSTQPLTFSDDASILFGVETLTLCWVDTLPMSLVFTQSAHSKYEILFRLAFTIKTAEALLLNTWKPLKEKSHSLQSSLIRSKMLHLWQSFLYYMFVEVFEPRFAKLLSELSTIGTLSELVQKHEDFLDSCMKECLLSNPKLMNMLEGLLSCTLGFVYHVLFLADHETTDPDGSMEILKYLEKYYPKSVMEGMHDQADQIQWFDVDFSNRLHQFLGSMRLLSLAETPRLAHLALQLDFNGYYSLQ